MRRWRSFRTICVALWPARYNGWKASRAVSYTHLDVYKRQAFVSEGNRRFEFAGSPGTIPRISYAEVLEGKIPAAFFTGKTVLVGVTAVGLGDFLPTPVSARAQPMPGVEVQANIWLSMRDRRLITVAPIWASTLFLSLIHI